MKSRTILTLPVASDLTETTLYRAQEMIIEYNIANSSYGSAKWQVLRVASQNMGVAPFLGAHIGASFEISPTYTSDEWSLSEISYDKGERHIVTVHSEGA
jgi:hypothetical protein